MTAKEFDVVVFLIEVEVEITAALGAFQPPGKHTRLLGDGGFLAPCAFLQRLHLFPSDPVNNRLMDIKEDGPVFLRVLNAPFHLIGL